MLKSMNYETISKNLDEEKFFRDIKPYTELYKPKINITSFAYITPQKMSVKYNTSSRRSSGYTRNIL